MWTRWAACSFIYLPVARSLSDCDETHTRRLCTIVNTKAFDGDVKVDDAFWWSFINRLSRLLIFIVIPSSLCAPKIHRHLSSIQLCVCERESNFLGVFWSPPVNTFFAIFFITSLILSPLFLIPFFLFIIYSHSLSSLCKNTWINTARFMFYIGSFRRASLYPLALKCCSSAHGSCLFTVFKHFE